MVGLNASKLFCIVCKSPDLFPQVGLPRLTIIYLLTCSYLDDLFFFLPQAVPKPVLTLLDLSFPLASSDLGAENLENEFIFSNMHLCQVYDFPRFGVLCILGIIL